MKSRVKGGNKREQQLLFGPRRRQPAPRCDEYGTCAIIQIMETKIKQFSVIFRPEAEGGFTVTVPSLPGCITYGKDLTQAKEMARDAISGYLASLKKHRQKISSDEGSFVTLLSVGRYA